MGDLKDAIEKMDKTLLRLEEYYLIFAKSKSIANENNKLELEIKKMKNNNAVVKEKIDKSLETIDFIIKDSENG